MREAGGTIARPHKLRRWLWVFLSIVAAMLLDWIFFVRGRTSADSFPSAEARKVFEENDHLYLYSLDPFDLPGNATKKEEPEWFHGRKVLGRVELTSPDVKRQAIQVYYKSLHPIPVGAMCFDPRHAFRAERDGKTVDVVVCFECGFSYAYFQGVKKVSHVSQGNEAGDLLTKILKERGIKSAPAFGEQ